MKRFLLISVMLISGFFLFSGAQAFAHDDCYNGYGYNAYSSGGYYNGNYGYSRSFGYGYDPYNSPGSSLNFGYSNRHNNNGYNYGAPYYGYSGRYRNYKYAHPRPHLYDRHHIGPYHYYQHHY